MPKLILFITLILTSAALIGTPIVFPRQDAYALTRAESTELSTAISKTNMAVQKSQGETAFTDAVKSQNSGKIKSLLVMHGAPDSISEVKFVKSEGSPQKVKIEVSGSCCPVTIIITIRF